MRNALRLPLAILLFASPGAAFGDDADDTANRAAETAALAAMDEFMTAFNSSDAVAWSRTLNYPHVRVAAGDVKVWQTPDEYAAGFDFDAFTRRVGWDHSAWDYKRVVQSSPDKIHIAVRFTRYRADNSKISSYESLYIVTERDGHWGVQARSSFAP